MTIRSIHIKGSPVLHARASEVEVFDRSLKKLVNDMYETMDEAPGVGLAAPQVGVALRVFVYDYEDAEGNPVRGEVINPKLELGKLSLGRLPVFSRRAFSDETGRLGQSHWSESKTGTHRG
jgi:peptide deformylase